MAVGRLEVCWLWPSLEIGELEITLSVTGQLTIFGSTYHAPQRRFAARLEEFINTTPKPPIRDGYPHATLVDMYMLYTLPSRTRHLLRSSGGDCTDPTIPCVGGKGLEEHRVEE